MLILPADKVCGTIRLPGDKSISHRIVLLSLLNQGIIKVSELSDCEDVQTSLKIVSQLGVEIKRNHNQTILDSRKMMPANDDLLQIDCGNSGTTTRLLSGILCRRPGIFRLTGDDSLSHRPMRRIIEPLIEMGAEIVSENTDRLPLVIKGIGALSPISFNNSLSSAQVKSAILFAATGAAGKTTVREDIPSRDHTERLLQKAGMPLHSDSFSHPAELNDSKYSSTKNRSQIITLEGPCNLCHDFDFAVPGDISSAAFFITAAAIIPGSYLVIENILLNPGRTGFINVLQRMGADISISVSLNDWEPRGKIEVRGAGLCATSIQAEEIPGLIDELPVLAAAMAFAEGESFVSGANELRHKESDRISSLVKMLQTAGIRCDERPDGYSISGPATVKNQPELDPASDHRLAMTAAVIGLKSDNGIILKQPESVSISFPGFFQTLKTTIKK